MTGTEASKGLELLAALLDRARAAGADGADALISQSVSQAVAWRGGALERTSRAEAQRLGLRVLIGHRQAIVSTADDDPKGFADLAERAVRMARAVPEDPYCGLADSHQSSDAKDGAALDLCDAREPDVAFLAAQAGEMENAARAVQGVVNFRSIDAGWSRSRSSFASTNGFSGSYRRSYWWMSLIALAERNGAMERDWAHDARAHHDDLMSPAAVGREAGERAARRLGGVKAASRKVPVVFEARIAGQLLDHLAGALGGQAVARGTSLFKDKMGEAIFAPNVTIIDDPGRPRGPRSRPFDGEGLAQRRTALVENGRLASWLLDLATARQLGLAPTGHAWRNPDGPPTPGPSNLRLLAGAKSPQTLIGEIADGLLVTELMGQGVNLVTGDYSRGAAGFWIENGQITHPVSEVTIAGNLTAMFATLEPADDLELRLGVDAPSVRVDGMTVAGR